MLWFGDACCHCWCWSSCWNSSWVFRISCRDLFSLRVCIFYISFGTPYIHIHPWTSYKLPGLNWVSKNRRAVHDVEFVLGSTKKDPKNTPDRVFKNIECSITFGMEGVPSSVIRCPSTECRGAAYLHIQSYMWCTDIPPVAYWDIRNSFSFGLRVRESCWKNLFYMTNKK